MLLLHRIRTAAAALAISTASLLISHPLLAQSSVVLSQRTGSTIDSSGREYFGLFPRISDFLSAEARSGQDGTIDLLIRRRSASDTSITINQATAHELGRYLDNLESMFLGRDSVDWNLLRTLVHPYRPFDDYKALTITDRNGDRYTASLLYASDSVLVLWPTDSLYDWRTLGRNARAFHASQIERIERPNAYYPGLGAGVLIGGTTSYIINSNVSGKMLSFGGAVLAFFGISYLGGYIGRSIGFDAVTEGDFGRYRDAVGSLKDRAYFYATPPPEVIHFIDRISQPVAESSSPITKNPPPAEETEYNTRFHIGFGMGKLPTTSFGDYKINTVGRISQHPVQTKSSVMYADLKWNILPLMQLGAIAMKNDVVARDSNDVEYMDFESADLFVNIILIPAGSIELRGVEFSAGAGIGLTGIDGSGILTYPYAASNRSPTPYSFNRTIPGFYIRTSLAYYLFKYLSLEARIDQRIVPPVTVPEVVLTSSVGPVKKLMEHELNLSTIETMLALQIHF
jgi:hypothetical protein